MTWSLAAQTDGCTTPLTTATNQSQHSSTSTSQPPITTRLHVTKSPITAWLHIRATNHSTDPCHSHQSQHGSMSQSHQSQHGFTSEPPITAQLHVTATNHNTVSCHARHSTGHYEDDLPSQSLDWYSTPSLLNQSLDWYNDNQQQQYNRTANICTN